MITAKSFSHHAVDSAIDWKVLKIIVVNKRKNVGAVSTPKLNIASTGTLDADTVR